MDDATATVLTARHITATAMGDGITDTTTNTPSCMLDRNRYLVDHAAYLLAVYDESGKGGTAYTIKYANQKGREVIIIPAVNCRKAIDIEEVQ